MKKYLFITSLFIGSLANAQPPPPRILYSYDLSGNRIHREFRQFRLINPNEDLSKSDFGISAFPNPSSGTITVSISKFQEGDVATIYIIDEQGKIVLTRETNKQEELLDIDAYNAGIYYLRVIIREKDVTYKIVRL